MLKTQKSLLSRRSSSRKRSYARKKISKYLKTKKEQIKSLVDYVKNQSSSIQNYNNIYNLLKNQKEKNVTLFRGNGDDKKDPESINIGKWFSTTENEDIALKEFSGEKCCVFIIHVLNTKILDVNKFVKDKISDYSDEKEIIVLGGGKFYKNKECTEIGYNNLGIKNNKEYFECYYKVSKNSSKKSNKTTKKNKYDLDKIIQEIKEDDSTEFIDSLDELYLTFRHLLKYVRTSDKQKILDKLLSEK